MTASASAHDAHGHAGHGHDGHGHDGHEEHIHPPSYYVKTWAILLVLLVISIIGPELGIRAVTLMTAFGIAVVKAYLVCARFMHLDIEKKFVAYFLTVSLGFMGLFFFAIAPDVLKHEGTNWKNYGATDEIARHDLSKPDHGHDPHAEKPASEELKAKREEALKKLQGIDAAMKAVATDLKAPPPPPAETPPADGAAAPKTPAPAGVKPAAP
jgi:caa(3)-type oxidase subunit IV